VLVSWRHECGGSLCGRLDGWEAVMALVPCCCCRWSVRGLTIVLLSFVVSWTHHCVVNGG
jgi:hypothetical protein